MRQSRLLLLSPELILLICDDSELDLDDLKHLRLTCKSLAEGLAFLVLRHIFISAGEATAYSEIISDLRSLSQSNSAFARYTREITISSLSIVQVHIGDNEEQMKDAILKAIFSLKSVDTVTWHTSLCEDEPGLLQETIWDAILILGPNLLDLAISAVTLQVPLNDIESLTKLESIAFPSMPLAVASASIVSAVSRLYFSSSTLKSITIRNHFSNPGLSTRSLHMPSGSPSLRHLDLANCFIAFDEPTTLSRLSNLTSLTYSVYPPMEDPKYSPDEMWMALKASGIRLEELDLREGAMAVSLVDYLSTFSGLKKLRLNLICFTSPTGTAAQFWSTALPNHTNTLEEFILYAGEEGEWCFSTHNRSLIVQCTKLKSLGLCILCQSEQDVLPKNLILDDVKAMLEMAVTDMPCLEHLNLRVAGPIGPRDGILRWTYGEVMICNWLPMYEPPTSCGYLPWLSVGELCEHRSTFLRIFGTRNCDMKLTYEEVKIEAEEDVVDSDSDSE